MQIGYGTPRTLVYPRTNRRRRLSSYNRAGGNRDLVQIKNGGRAALADIEATGSISHIWMTANCSDRQYTRKMLLRMWWDGPYTSAAVDHDLPGRHQSFRNSPLTKRLILW